MSTVDVTAADMVDRVTRYAHDPAYRARLNAAQHSEHKRTAAWLHSRDLLPPDVANALGLAAHDPARGKRVIVPRDAAQQLYGNGPNAGGSQG